MTPHTCTACGERYAVYTRAKLLATIREAFDVLNAAAAPELEQPIDEAAAYLGEVVAHEIDRLCPSCADDRNQAPLRGPTSVIS